jgi:putative tryptophan/tyrosine transport system substrate-binding protein
MRAQQLAVSRRRFVQTGLALAGLGLLTGCGVPLNPWGRSPRVYRVGFLGLNTAEAGATNFEAFREGMRDLGYVEGQAYTIDRRWAEGRVERLPELAAELVRAEPDVIVAGNTDTIRAAIQATTTIPIVFPSSGDPVARGFVASLARPGGNVTGITQEGGQESTKRLELLTSAFPTVSRVGVLWTQSVVLGFRQAQATAEAIGRQVVSLEVKDPHDLGSVLSTAITEHVDGLSVQGSALFEGPPAEQIVEFANRQRLPAIYGTTVFVRTGGLLVYAPNFPSQYRRAATYVDKILKGARPADLPVEGPTRYDFVVNLRTAQALGLTIPQSVLAQATELIQ